jgi:hypothetical protein
MIREADKTPSIQLNTLIVFMDAQQQQQQRRRQRQRQQQASLIPLTGDQIAP